MNKSDLGFILQSHALLEPVDAFIRRQNFLTIS